MPPSLHSYWCYQITPSFAMASASIQTSMRCSPLLSHQCILPPFHNHPLFHYRPCSGHNQRNFIRWLHFGRPSTSYLPRLHCGSFSPLTALPPPQHHLYFFPSANLAKHCSRIPPPRGLSTFPQTQTSLSTICSHSHLLPPSSLPPHTPPPHPLHPRFLPVSPPPLTSTMVQSGMMGKKNNTSSNNPSHKTPHLSGPCYTTPLLLPRNPPPSPRGRPLPPTQYLIWL